MNLFYLVNYNRFIVRDTSYLFDVYFNGQNILKKIAFDVLINDNRLLDNRIDVDILENFIKSVDIEVVWQLASLDHQYYIAQIAYDYLMEIIDNSIFNNNRQYVK